MSRLAIDVVLLPDRAMIEKAIAISSRLQEKENGPFKLGTEDYFPHVTLAMGVINEGHIDKGKEILKELAQRTRPLSLMAEKLDPLPSLVGGFVSCIEVGKTPELKELHRQMIERFVPLLTFDSSPDIFVEPETIQEGTMRFIKNFPKRFDFNEYHPHITIGRGAAYEPFEPVAFTAPTLGLCQLGQFCTCRKILASFELKAQK